MLNSQNQTPIFSLKGSGQNRKSRLKLGISSLGKRTLSQQKLGDSTSSTTPIAPEEHDHLKDGNSSALAFTPRRCLRRTPPLSGPAREEEKGGRDLGFTPTHTLQHTPPGSGTGSDEEDGQRSGGVGRLKRRSSSSESQNKTGLGEEVPELPVAGKASKRPLSVRDSGVEGMKRGVQGSCFSPRKTLRRSLPSAVPESEVCEVWAVYVLV